MRFCHYFMAILGVLSEGSAWAQGAWNPNLTTNNVATASGLDSSTRLSASWSAASAWGIDHYRITATEAATGWSKSVNTPLTTIEIDGLKSATPYDFTIDGCLDSGCATTATKTGLMTSNSATNQEHWKFRGSTATDSVSGLTHMASDGNSGTHAFRYGSDAGGSLADTIRLYYNPTDSGTSHHGTSAATMVAGSVSTIASISSFTSGKGVTGTHHDQPATYTGDFGSLGTVKAIPVRSGTDRVRLFFSARETTYPDASTLPSRIYYLDSTDGFTGKDFNTNATDTLCDTEDFYSTGTGDCLATTVIGLDGETTEGNTSVTHARQFEVGYPKMTDWAWNQDSGFMFFTMTVNSACTNHDRQQGYALYDAGSDTWDVQYDGSCPKAFENVTAPSSVHLGDYNYKLYFGDTTSLTGTCNSIAYPETGAKKVMYAYGSSSTIDYADWEDPADARDVVFHWPSGNVVSVGTEACIDDFAVLSANGNLTFQAWYMTITDGTTTPFVALATLMNP